MSPHWKTAIKFGVVWGILATVFFLLSDLQEKSFQHIVQSSPFWLKARAYIAIGVFPVGYFSTRPSKSND